MISYEPNYPEHNHAASIHIAEGVAARRASAGPIPRANPLTRFGHAHRHAPTLQAFVQRSVSSDHVAGRRRGQGSQTGPPCAAAAAGLAW